MFKLPEFPSIDFSDLDLNALRDSKLVKRLAAIDSDKVTTALRDAAYMTLGVGVVAVERAQATMEAQQVRIDDIEVRVASFVDRIESALPEQAGHLVGQARDISRVARDQVRGLIRNAA
jgi:uncharacterized protein (DUF111 family)